jgi:hypothetical protein
MNATFKFFNHFFSNDHQKETTVEPVKQRDDFGPLFSCLAEIEKAALLTSSSRETIGGLRTMAEDYFGPQPEMGENELHRLMHALPVNPVEALVQLGLRTVTNVRLQAKWYAKKLVFLINAEKASSTLHEIVIRDIQLKILGIEANFGIQRGLRYGPTEWAYRTLHGLLPLYAPDGGILRGPFLAHYGNFRVIDELRAKVVLLCRHPADRLVARGCMTGESPELIIKPEDVESGYIFERLIYENHLPQSLDAELHWLVGWAKYGQQAGKEKFLLLRYENMVSDAEKHFNRLHRFVTDQPMSPALWSDIQSKMNRTAGGDLQPGDRTKRHYPKGYTGRVDIWRDYLTSSAVKGYNLKVEAFMNYHPDAKMLLKVYPDIYLE